MGLVALLGALGPSLAAFLWTGHLNGSSGVRAPIKRLFVWRVHWTVYAAVLFGPLLLALAPMGLNATLGEPAPRWPQSLRIAELLHTTLKMLLIGGQTEELGWRGFALPILRRQRGPLVASLALGLVSGFWHVPFYSLPGLGNPLPAGELFWFVVSTPLLAIFFKALAERRRDSVGVAVTFDAWTNTVFYGLPGLLHVPETAMLRLLNQLAWLVVARLSAWSWHRLQRLPARGRPSAELIEAGTA